MDFTKLDALTLTDLIGVPYVDHGRDLNGLDCYGAAIFAVYILTKKKLNDVVYNDHNAELSDILAPTLNVRKTSEIKAGNVIETTFNKRLHIATIINNKDILHATAHGVRISPIRHLPIINIYEVL